MKLPSLAECRKGLAALTGAAAEAVSLGLLSGQAERWTVGGLAVASALAVYLVPNAKPVVTVIARDAAADPLVAVAKAVTPAPEPPVAPLAGGNASDDIVRPARTD